MRGRKEKWAGAVVEEFNQIARAANVSTEGADGFGECPDLNVDAPVDVEVIDGAAAITSQDARGMSVVNHHDGVVLFGKVAERGQGTDVTVHGEYAVGDDELASRLIFDGGELLF